MLSYALQRLGIATLVALTASLLTFSMIYASGDPAIALAGEGARAQDVENIRLVYRLGRPVVAQYLDWLGSALRGDLGHSFLCRSRSRMSLPNGFRRRCCLPPARLRLPLLPAFRSA